MTTRFAPLALALILTACGQPEAPAPAAETPAAEAPAPAPEPLSTGALGAMSNTAMALTGAITITPNTLQFEKGFTAATEFVDLADATTPIAVNGASFAETAPGPSSLRIEIRRIIPQAPQPLCGSVNPATYVAIASDEPLTGATLIFFTGADQPSAEAEDSHVCATFSYAVD